MSHTSKIATIRGAGLAFPIACLWYVYSGQLFAFSLVPVGAGAGFLVGLFLQRQTALPSREAISIPAVRSQESRPAKPMQYLSHPNAVVRFGGLLALGSLLFLLAWYAGYFLLPEGVFRGGAEAHMVRSQLTAPSGSVFEEWTRIFRANLLAVLVLVLGSLLIRVNGVSFGYLVALFNLIGYGLFIGTNSFAVPYPQRMAPSFEILSRGGPYEMAALVLLASTTYFWSFFEVRRLFLTSPERVKGEHRFAWKDAIGIGLGLALLAFGNWIEAWMVVSA